MVYPPTFYMHLLLEEERLHVWHARNLLVQLSRYVQQFEAAVLLCQFANARLDEHRAKIETESPDSPNRRDLIRALMHDKTREWIFIAHRDSVMAVYHFAKTFQSLKDALKDCPEFRTYVDSNKLNIVWRAFHNSRFPDWEAARHAVGHSAELSGTKERASLNALKGPYESDGIKSTGKDFLMIGVIEGDRMTSTRADPHSKTAKPLATSCSPDALARLEKTRDETFSVFWEASKKLIEAKADPKVD